MVTPGRRFEPAVPGGREVPRSADESGAFLRAHHDVQWPAGQPGARLFRANSGACDERVRTRAQMVLLAAEQGLVAAESAPIVRQDEETVRRWLARYPAEGIEGLSDAPRSGAPPRATPAYCERLLALARQHPRALGLPFSLWTGRRAWPTIWRSRPACG